MRRQLQWSRQGKEVVWTRVVSAYFVKDGLWGLATDQHVGRIVELRSNFQDSAWHMIGTQ